MNLGCVENRPATTSSLPHPASGESSHRGGILPLPRSKPLPPPSTASLRVSRTRRERSAALELVHQNYCKAGLAQQAGRSMRVMKHHLVDTTKILIAKRLNHVLFTATLVGDGQAGLPADSLFAEEIAQMRSEGLRLAEVSCLASNGESLDPKERLETLISIIGLTIHTARRHGIDRLLLAVHPRHAKVYRRMFGCVPCSDVKEYEAVQGNPAVLCMHDFAALDTQRYSLYERVYSRDFENWELDGVPMSDEEKKSLAAHLGDSTHSFLPIAA